MQLVNKTSKAVIEASPTKSGVYFLEHALIKGGNPAIVSKAKAFPNTI